jgi:3-dehydroquinate dehydratase/shikimate dehydrogenase
MAELVVARDAAAVADMVELRLDGVKDVDVERALLGRRRPVIVTCRPGWEGGRFTGSEDERNALLTRALASGADYVDVEWRALQHVRGTTLFDDLVQSNPARVVLSSHDFDGVPADLCARARAMRGTGAAVIKVAVTAARLSDSLPLLEVARGGNAVVIGMGDAGLPSRLLATRFGSLWTYGGKGVAPGQIPATRMLEQFRFRSVGERTSLYGVVGDSVLHSLSPVMHNAAFATAGLDAVCVPLCAADFNDFLTFADALGFCGASVTNPFTLDALQTSRAADDAARRVGAANTLRRVEGGWEATNTDDGLLMLVAQAERQFEWWTGRRPAPGVMQAAAKETDR